VMKLEFSLLYWLQVSSYETPSSAHGASVVCIDIVSVQRLR
jgi:hypothetical protein